MRQSLLDDMRNATPGNGTPLDVIYLQWKNNKSPFIPVPYFNLLASFLSTNENEQLLHAVFSNLFSKNLDYSQLIQEYKEQIHNLSPFAQNNCQRYTPSWKLIVQNVVQLPLPRHLLHHHILPLASPPPLSSARYRFVNGPTFMWERTKTPRMYEMLNNDIFNQLERKVIPRWINHNGSKYGRMWSINWKQFCFQHIGLQWESKPLNILISLLKFSTHHGLHRYGKYEYHSLIEAMYLVWGRSKTLEKLYLVWNWFMVNQLTQIAEGPLLQLIAKCTLAFNYQQFQSLPFCFNNEFSESLCRFAFKF